MVELSECWCLASRARWWLPWADGSESGVLSYTEAKKPKSQEGKLQCNNIARSGTQKTKILVHYSSLSKKCESFGIGWDKLDPGGGSVQPPESSPTFYYLVIASQETPWYKFDTFLGNSISQMIHRQPTGVLNRA